MVDENLQTGDGRSKAPLVIVGLVVAVILLVGGFVVREWLNYRDEVAVVAERVVQTEALATNLGSFGWSCDGYAGTMDLTTVGEGDSDPMKEFQAHLSSIGFEQKYEGQYFRERSDGYDADMVTIRTTATTASITVELWDTDGIPCMPGVLARQIDLGNTVDE